MVRHMHVCILVNTQILQDISGKTRKKLVRVVATSEGNGALEVSVVGRFTFISLFYLLNL